MEGDTSDQVLFNPEALVLGIILRTPILIAGLNKNPRSVSNSTDAGFGRWRAEIQKGEEMETTKRALLVGIDHYQQMPPLTGGVADALAVGDLLRRNENGSPNYDCRVLTSADGPPITRARLRPEWQTVFGNFEGHNLCDFSGHGTQTKAGASLVTQDGTRGQ